MLNYRVAATLASRKSRRNQTPSHFLTSSIEARHQLRCLMHPRRCRFIRHYFHTTDLLVPPPTYSRRTPSSTGVHRLWLFVSALSQSHTRGPPARIARMLRHPARFYDLGPRCPRKVLRVLRKRCSTMRLSTPLSLSERWCECIMSLSEPAAPILPQ